MDAIHPLRAFRERQEPKLSQQRLAELLEVSRPTVTRWETGARKIEEAAVMRVSERTGISPAELRPDLAERAAAMFRQPEVAA